jgi:hypothetical protein
MHHADMSRFWRAWFDEATYIFKVLDSEKTSEILLELNEDLQNILKDFLKGYAEGLMSWTRMMPPISSQSFRRPKEEVSLN